MTQGWVVYGGMRHAEPQREMFPRSYASNLDKVASNAVLWGTGKTRGIHRPLHVLRFRFLETITKDKLHTQNPD